MLPTLPKTIPDYVMDSKTLESENNRSQTRSLDLRNSVLRHAFFPELFTVDPEALPCRGSSCPSCSLLSFTPPQQQHPEMQT